MDGDESRTEIVDDPLSSDMQIRAVLDQFAASHQTVEAKPGKRAAKKKEAPVTEPEEERELEPGESLPGATFEGMGSEDLDDEDEEPDGLPVVHRKPKPDAGQKDDIWGWYEKFKVGQDPDMSIQLFRTYPKIFPNGVVAEGPLDAFPTPIDEEYIASTYGGGMYEIYAMGPGKGGHGKRRFSKFTVKIPGAADFTKPSSLVRDAANKGEPRMQVPVVPQASSENVGVVQQALKTLEKTSDDAQKRARVAEDRVINGATNGATEAVKFSSMLRDESDKRVQLLQDQSQRESQLLRDQSAREAQLLEERAQRESQHLREQAERDKGLLEERLRERDQQLNELRGEVTKMQSVVPSSIKEIVELIRPQQAPGVGQDMMNSILTKHAAEIEAMRGGHAREVEATRAAHLREIDSMRSNYEREREGDRREAAAREQRVVDQLEQAREERRRDNEMHKQVQEQRDTASRDREQSRSALEETMWQSRMRSAEDSTNFRVNSLNAELERLRGEVADLRSKAREDGDVYTQIERAKQIIDVARDGVGGGLSGADAEMPTPMPQQAAPKGMIEQLVEYGPMIGKVVTDIVNSDAVGGGKKNKRRQQQPPPMGSVINTPQGRMVVTPQGYVPEYLYAQQVQGQQNHQPRMFQQPQPQPQQPQQGPPRQYVQMQQQPGQPQGQQRPQEQQRPQGQQPRRTSRPQDGESALQTHSAQVENVVVAPNIYEAQEQMAGAKEPLSGTAASFVARAIDDGLNAAMEVDEFINSIRGKVPETYLQDLVKYTAPEIIASVREHAPKSLVLSPGGVEFTVNVMRRLRAMYGITA
jgi:hypothetical protein